MAARRRPLPDVTERTTRSVVAAIERTEQLRAAKPELVRLALSYENHTRQMWMLLAAHVVITLLIALLTATIGHLHTAQIALIETVLLAAFAFALAVFGIQTHRVWLPRAFALGALGLATWSLLVVSLAVVWAPRVRSPMNGTLLALQVLDVFIAAGYLYTVEQIAAAGGAASATVADLHKRGLIVTPLAATTPTSADWNYMLTRPTAWRRFRACIDGAMKRPVASPLPR